jgi:hypothetical protein
VGNVSASPPRSSANICVSKVLVKTTFRSWCLEERKFLWLPACRLNCYNDRAFGIGRNIQSSHGWSDVLLNDEDPSQNSTADQHNYALAFSLSLVRVDF